MHYGSLVKRSIAIVFYHWTVLLFFIFCFFGFDALTRVILYPQENFMGNFELQQQVSITCEDTAITFEFLFELCLC